MRINREINLPEALITAQREGRLVVFAGAGVSVSAPSNLPLFDPLATQIAADSQERRENEAADAYLGRIASDVDVDKRARDILDAPTTQPCSLHRQIVGLFKTAETLRIVTTNFDRHFTTVAQQEFGAGVDLYYAPALPLGRSFSGVVYVHGSVARHDPLVLTDTEFGRAYLTEGWASRFLTDMFMHHTVLFVGYSHADTVMQYLARAFAGRTQRYAFVTPGNDDHWRRLGIIPVHYPERPAPTPHGALGEALDAWSGLARMGVLDHERRIQEITAGAPPIDPDVADYMEWVIRQAVTLRLFVKHAKTIEWLNWVDDKGALTELYSGIEQPTEESAILAEWIASSFAASQPRESIRLLARHDLNLNGRLWHAIAFELARRDPTPSVECLMAWIPVLCASLQKWGTSALSRILHERGHELPKGTTLLLFQTLIAVRTKVDRVWQAVAEPDAAVGYEVQLAGEMRDVRLAWSEKLRPRLAELHGELLWVLTSALVDAHLYAQTTGDEGRWDRLSFGRAAIEPHGQDRHPDEWEFLVDAARDVLEWMLEQDAEAASAVIEMWLAMDQALLQRLGIHGLIKQRGDPDTLLRRIEKEHWLYDPPGKHEVFALIEYAFPLASAAAQRRFVEHSMQERHRLEGRAEAEGDDELRRSIEYERYNVAVWLARVAPESAAARDHLVALQAQHQDFGPREHPDLGAWSSGVHAVVPKSPITVDEMLARPPAESVGFFLEYQPASIGFDEPDRSGLLTFLTEAASRDVAWSSGLASALIEREEVESDVWGAILSGWRRADLEAEQWRELLRMLRDNVPLIAFHPRDVVDLIERAVEDKSKLPFELLDAVEWVLDTAVANAGEELAIGTQGRTEWLTQAINHVGGRAALAWVRALSKRRAAAEGPWEQMPAEYRDRFEFIARQEGVAYQLARVAIASQVQFLFSIDPDWTTRNIIPWFDWTENERRAEQAWHGFSVWGQWSNTLATAMMVQIRQTFGHLGTDLEEVRDQLVGRLAGLAIYSSIDPWPNGWLLEFIREAEPVGRGRWAGDIARELAALKEEQLNALWDRWLRAYWRDRLTGVPRQLSDEEKAEMIGWAVGGRFDEAVELVVQTTGPAGLDEFALYRLHDENIAATNPRSTALLLRYIVRSYQRIGYACSWIGDIALQALDNGAPRDVLRDIAEEMARLGCPNAAVVAERVQRPVEGGGA